MAGEQYPGVQYSRATGWVAWVLFGGLLLVLLGALHLIFGLTGLLRPEALAATRAGLALPIPIGALAGLHLALGVAATAAGYGLFRGLGWARIVSILLCCLVALVNFAFAAVHPVWAVLAVTLSALVAYAVAVHGGEIAEASGSGAD